MTAPYKRVREHLRYAIDVRAKLSGDGQVITARTLDISDGGVGLISPVALPLGSVFVISFELPAVAGEFRAQVQLQSRSGFRCGFKFVLVDEASSVALRRFVRRTQVPAKEDYAGAQQ